MWTLTSRNLNSVASKLEAKVIPVTLGRAILLKTSQWSYDVAVPGDTIEPTVDGYARVVRRKEP